LGSHVEHHAFGQRREHGSYELTDIVGSKDPLPSKSVKLSSRKRHIGFRTEHTLGRIGHLETYAKSPRRIFHDDMRATGLARDTHGLSVQSDAIDARERSEHSHRSRTVEDPATMATQCFLDGEIVGSRRDGRTPKPSRRQSVQRHVDDMKLFVFLSLSRHTTLEEDSLGDAAKPVLERTGSARCFRTLATRDRDGGNVLARIEGAIAIAIPFDVFEIERDRGRQRRALDVDPGGDFFVAA